MISIIATAEHNLELNSPCFFGGGGSTKSIILDFRRVMCQPLDYSAY